MNRFDQYNWGNLQLPTLQEMSLVPEMKRRQHDDMLNQAYSKVLNIDNHYIHQDIADEVRNYYDNNLNTLVDRINTEGINDSTKQDFIKFNKEYGQLTGQGGIVDKLKQAKKSIYDGMENYLKDSNTKKYGVDVSQAYFNDQLYNYKNNYNKNKQIELFNPTFMPEHYDVQEWINKGMQNLGHTVTDVLNNPHTQREIINGKVVLRTTSTSTKDKNNIAQAQAAINGLLEQYNNPYSPIRQSFDLQGLDSNKIGSILDNALKSRIVTEKTRTRNMSSLNLGKDETVVEGGGVNEITLNNPYNSMNRNVKGELQNNYAQQEVDNFKTVVSDMFKPIDGDSNSWANRRLMLKPEEKNKLNEMINRETSKDLRIYLKNAGLNIKQNSSGKYEISDNITRGHVLDAENMLIEIHSNAKANTKVENKLVAIGDQNDASLHPAKVKTNDISAIKNEIENEVSNGAKLYDEKGEEWDKGSGWTLKSYNGYINPTSEQFRNKNGDPIYTAQQLVYVDKTGKEKTIYKEQGNRNKNSDTFKITRVTADISSVLHSNPNAIIDYTDLSKDSRQLLESNIPKSELEKMTFQKDSNGNIIIKKGSIYDNVLNTNPSEDDILAEGVNAVRDLILNVQQMNYGK